ncbi:hypothetical protein HK104_001143, partial [Borealophlyctis nickersoniae]
MPNPETLDYHTTVILECGLIDSVATSHPTAFAEEVWDAGWRGEKIVFVDEHEGRVDDHETEEEREAREEKRQWVKN